MDYRDSDIFRQLVADGLARGTAGTVEPRRDTASRRKALSFMGWANALADREEEADKVHSPTAGGGFRPMGIRKGAEAEAPASNQPGREAGDPSMARSHPVLLLVSSRQNLAPRKTKRAKSCLMLVVSR